MTRIEVTEGRIEIDADILSRVFGDQSGGIEDRMRDGTISSRAEHGQAEDAGKIRLRFFSNNHRVRITADRQGNVLTCDKARIAADTRAPGDLWTLDALLDEALAQSFPASDPIACQRRCAAAAQGQVSQARRRLTEVSGPENHKEDQNGRTLR